MRAASGSSSAAGDWQDRGGSGV